MGDEAYLTLHNILAKDTEDARDLTDLEKDTLYTKLSKLSLRDCRTIYGLMVQHRKLYPRRNKTVKQDEHPYDMQQVGEDLHVYADSLPNKLVNLLNRYICRMEELEKEPFEG